MNRTLTVYRSRIEITPYTLGESETLENKLTLYDFVLRKVTMTLYKYNADTKTLCVPRGFSSEDTMAHLATDAIVDVTKINKIDSTRSGRDISLTMKPGVGAKDDHQIESISFLLNEKYIQKFLNIDTGYGKTFCTIKAISVLGKAAMIIMGNSNLMKQWEKSLHQFTYIKKDEIRIISGRDSVIRSMKEKEKAKIYICSTQTMSILSEENELQSFIDANGIGIKVIDEAHERMNAVVTIDLGCDVRNNFYLTATPERSDTREAILYLRITKTFDKFGAYTTKLSKYIHVKNVLINTHPIYWHKRICQTKKGFSAVMYEKFIFKDDKKKIFFYLICKYVVSKILGSDPDGKVLILFSIRESINEISRLFKHNDKYICGVFTADTSKEQKKKELDKNIILSTLKSSGAGMDIKNLRAIINFIPFKSPVLLHQLMGRLRFAEGKAMFYFNIVDEGYDSITKQNIHRQTFFRNKAADISNLSLDMNTLLSKIHKSKYGDN
ncbi:MAG: DEAD/DEAH box helicase [Anaeroplasmataceae bacterium]